MDKSIEAFPQIMVNGCEAALDAGVFYQEEFADWVLNHMGGFGCEGRLLGMVSVNGSEPGSQVLRNAVASAVREQQRGTYVVMKVTLADGRSWCTVLVSAGGGELGTGVKHDTYDQPPAADKVLRRMLGYEIYLCRKAVEARRALIADCEALAKHGFRVGMELKDLKISGEPKPYSRGIVDAVDAASGAVTLTLMRRGTSKRWSITLGAKRVAEIGRLQEPEPNKHPFVMLVPAGTDPSEVDRVGVALC